MGLEEKKKKSKTAEQGKTNHDSQSKAEVSQEVKKLGVRD